MLCKNVVVTEDLLVRKLSCVLPLDQEPFDFIEPNQEEEAALSGGDLQQGSPYVSCIKVKGNDQYVNDTNDRYLNRISLE